MKETIQVGAEITRDFQLEGDFLSGISWIEKFTAFAEQTCAELVHEHLQEDEITIGSGINIAMNQYFDDANIKRLSDLQLSIVTVSAELMEYRNGFLAFRVQVDDVNKLVASGIHIRKVIYV